MMWEYSHWKAKKNVHLKVVESENVQKILNLIFLCLNTSSWVNYDPSLHKISVWTDVKKFYNATHQKELFKLDQKCAQNINFFNSGDFGPTRSSKQVQYTLVGHNFQVRDMAYCCIEPIQMISVAIAHTRWPESTASQHNGLVRPLGYKCII